MHTDCAKSCRLDPCSKCFCDLGFQIWIMCLLMSKSSLVYKQIGLFVVNLTILSFFFFFIIHRANTHYNVEFVRISICRNSSWAAASFIHQWARRPAPLMPGKLSLQVAEPRWLATGRPSVNLMLQPNITDITLIDGTDPDSVASLI